MPSDNTRIKQVGSFHELLSTPLADGVNALCWPRALAGNFGEVATLLARGDDAAIITADETVLRALSVSDSGRAAIQILLDDLRLLRDQALDPVLNCIRDYPRDDEAGPICTDVFSFHVDSAPVIADTWLCTYYGPSSEGLSNDKAQRRIDLPETRAALLKVFGGADDDAFRDYLNENCYDLHYAPTTNAQPFSFGLGHLWRIACEYPGSPVPPCIHRAPDTSDGQLRLLLIS